MQMQNYINENNYTILKNKCVKYFEYYKKELNKKISLSENEQARIGFYFLMLEQITGITRLSSVCDMVIDTSFRKQWFDQKTREMGVDAINIDIENKTIQLFSFKYREGFKNTGNKDNDILPGIKFFMEIHNKIREKVKKEKVESDILEDSLNSIVSILNGTTNFTIEWYTITNENVTIFDSRSGFVDLLDSIQEMFNIRIELYNLKRITDLISSNNNKNIDAKIVIKSDSRINFSEYTNSMSHSLVLKIRLDDLVRISSNKQSLRLKTDNIQDDIVFQDLELDYNILSDNVRGYIVKSDINQNIIKTLENEPSKFFIYNNGLTLTVESIKEIPFAAGDSFELEFKNIQVINGGQTLRSIYEFKKKNKNALNILSKSWVLVRIFESDGDLRSKIAEYTNSQNAISKENLASLRKEQRDLKEYLKDKKIQYVIKEGHTGVEDLEEYDYKIDLSLFAQVLVSIKGYPEKATNQKKKLFDELYDDLFGEKNLKIEDSEKLILEYREVEHWCNIFNDKLPTKNKNKITDQEIFYMLYINHSQKSASVEEAKEILTGLRTKYKKEYGLGGSIRELIRADFREYLQKELGIKNPDINKNSLLFE